MVFARLSRIFLDCYRRVLRKMSVSCNCSCHHCMSNGRIAANFKLKKGKDNRHGFKGECQWPRRFTLIFNVSVVFGVCWFVYGGLSEGESKSVFYGDFDNLLFWKHYDMSSVLFWNGLSQNQFHALSDLGSLEQSSRVSEFAEEACSESCFWSSRTCWWLVAGLMVIVWGASHIHCLVWNKQQFPQSQQQLVQHEAQSKAQNPLNLLNPLTFSTEWQKTFLYVFVVFMFIVATGVFNFVNQANISNRNETLSNMCEERARMLQDQFNVSLNHVHALAILVSTYHHGKYPSAIDQSIFEEYTERTAFERPLTSGVAYALRVSHSERAQFEKHLGWTIRNMEHGDQTLVQDFDPAKMDPAPVRDEYAPVIFCQRTVSHIISIDMMSGKEDRDNIIRARATGKGVLTSPFKLLKSNHLGVVLTFAVYDRQLPPEATPEEHISATVGYLGASYDLRSLVEKILQQLASKETVVVNVYDTTNASAPINMYGTDVVETGLLRVNSLDFGDPSRKHEMHCRFKHKPPFPSMALLLAVIILIITLLLSQIFLGAVNRIREVEEVCEHMKELKARAEAADVAKSQFLATVSHEIRTPMNGVLGMLQMLMDTDLNDDQLDYAQTAHASGKDLISIINEVLDQAKIESGRLELEAVPFDLRAILDNIVSLFSGKSREKGIELAVYVSKEVPVIVIGDPGRFRQIITNLVGNSFKFMNDKGHIFVSVHLVHELVAASGVSDEVLQKGLNLSNDVSMESSLSGFRIVDRHKSWATFKQLGAKDSTENSNVIKLLVTVEDTGVGIPQDAQSRIFTPFMQADSSTSRHYGGTGIGLSISKCLVDLMGGEIGFVSECGVGSTFSFTALLMRGELDSSDPRWHTSEASVSELKGLRALVIDNRRIRAEVTRYHLQRLGIHVEMTSNLQSACSFICSNSTTSVSVPLAMVLVDKEVWEKELIVEIRRLLKNSSPSNHTDRAPKIFLITSISFPEKSDLKASHLVDDILTKPLRLSVLTGCFHEALSNGRKKQLYRAKPASPRSLLSGKQILVVDDNAVNRKVAEGALKKYGAIVTCVDSGKAAVTKLKPPHNFDACFMDLQMPEMDGFEATRQIRSEEKDFNLKLEAGEVSLQTFPRVNHWHTPILAMTADLIQATHEESIKCGMDGYVSKPFEEAQLYSAVACFFESR